MQNPSLSFGKIGQNTEPMSENARAVKDEKHIPELKNRSTYFGSYLDFDQQNTESKIQTYPTSGLSLASKIQRAKYIWIRKLLMIGSVAQRGVDRRHHVPHHCPWALPRP